jgi:ketosteroid isomerase-like protein
MRFLLKTAIFATILASSAAWAADAPSYIGQRASTSEDTQAIHKVIDDFQAAIKTKDTRRLASLMHSSNVLFTSPAPPAVIQSIRDKMDPNFDGLNPSGLRDFIRFIGTPGHAYEEKFYNVQITQDGNLAWVMFDYEFVADGKSSNHGVETWQMMKTADGQWKILSVVWSQHPLG